jgi:hypothetical protein
LITIDFKANINASASTSETTSSSTEVGASASVGGSFWGITANFSANYSSKKDSKATADSKYSVEYTMDVHVQASQSDMPAGLAKVLQILQDGITMSSTPPGGQLDFVMASNKLTPTTLSIPATVIATDANSAPLSGYVLSATSAQGSQVSVDLGTTPVSIGTDGTAQITVKLTVPTGSTLSVGAQIITITATPPTPASGTPPPAVTGTLTVNVSAT